MNYTPLKSTPVRYIWISCR